MGAHLLYNTAGASGGAVYGAAATAAAASASGTISGSSSSSSGMAAANATAGVVLILNSTVANNTAVGLHGGAFCGPVSWLELRQGAAVVGNSASSTGCVRGVMTDLAVRSGGVHDATAGAEGQQAAAARWSHVSCIKLKRTTYTRLLHTCPPGVAATASNQHFTCNSPHTTLYLRWTLHGVRDERVCMWCAFLLALRGFLYSEDVLATVLVGS